MENNNNKKKSIFIYSNKAWKNNKPYIKSLPSEKQWKNSIFLFNKNKLGNMYQLDKLVIRLSNGFYNMFRFSLEKKLKKDNFHLMRRRFKRLSFKKIFVSRPEIKHSVDKVLFTFYTYNRQKAYLLNKIKNLRMSNLQKFRYKKKVNSIKSILLRRKIQRLIISRNKKKNLIYKLIKMCLYRQEFINFNKVLNVLSNDTRNELKLYKKNSKFNLLEQKQKTYVKNRYLTRLFSKEILNNYYKLLLYINKSKFNETYLIKLGVILNKLYNKKIEFNIVNLKYFYLNSDILTQAVKIKLKVRKNRVLKVLRVLVNLVSIPKIKSKLSNINIESKTSLILPFSRKNLGNLKKDSNKINKKKEFLSLTAFKTITGVKMEASGRLTKRLTASRAISKSKQKGSLKNLNSSYKGLSSEMLRSQLKNNIDMTQVTSYVRNGSFGLKGWLAHL